MSGNRKLAEFRELLDRCGSRPEDWPAEKREKMLRFCMENPQARALLAEARALDTLLRATEVPPAAPDLAARLLRRAADIDRENGQVPPVVSAAAATPAANDNRPVMRWLASGWLAASLLVGIWLGFSDRFIVPSTLFDGNTTVAEADGDTLTELLGIVSSDEEGGETL